MSTTSPNSTSRIRKILRTAVVLIAGIFLSQLCSGVIAAALIPNLDSIVVHRYNPGLHAGVAVSPQEISRGIFMLRLVANPLAGMVVGAFVGFFQKSKPILIAILCWVPGILLFNSGTSLLRARLSESIQSVGGELLTILCCALTASVVWHLRQHGSKSRPKFSRV